MKNKLLNKNIFIVLGLSVLCMILYLRYSFFYGLNSDASVNVLRAKDILQGNLFLKNWYGSTVNGVFTWLIWPIIGILLCGFNENAICMAWGGGIHMFVHFAPIFKQ